MDGLQKTVLIIGMVLILTAVAAGVYLTTLYHVPFRYYVPEIFGLCFGTFMIILAIKWKA